METTGNLRLFNGAERETAAGITPKQPVEATKRRDLRQQPT